MRLSLRNLAFATLLCGSGLFLALNAAQASPEDELKYAIQNDEVGTVTKMLRDNKNIRISGTILDATGNAIPQIQRLIADYQKAQHAAIVTDETEDDDDKVLQAAIAMSMQNKGEEKKESLEEKGSTENAVSLLVQAIENPGAEGVNDSVKRVEALLKQNPTITGATTITTGWYNSMTLLQAAQNVNEKLQNIIKLLQQAPVRPAAAAPAAMVAQVNERQAIVNLLSDESGYGESLTASGDEWNAVIKAINAGDLATVQQNKHLFLPTSKSGMGRGKTLLQMAKWNLEKHPVEEKIAEKKAAKAAVKRADTGPVRFYVKTEPYYEFTNFWDKNPVLIDGVMWPSTENYFQAQKFIGNKKLYAEFQGFKTPREAFERADELKASVRSDWRSVNVAVMKKAVYEKFKQHKALRDILLSTGTREIIEHQVGHFKPDPFWADNGDGTGQNMLGKILMEVRDLLRYQFPE